MTQREAEINFPIGEKIIIIANEPTKGDNPDKLIVANVKGYHHVNDNYFIVWEDEDNNEYMSFSKPMLYSRELEEALNKLTWYERWNIYSHGWSIISKDEANKKEDK